ncbi:hypothetical protein Ga0074812_14832 [Parafrankia irregularis]|uniref:C2H2-type domain-containing protein n=1 Tax=Parafrankia irregularis TaxID=795642 RepID=A0A0S4QYX4_9ACTN|nr:MULTISPECIES: hypothetical protein [Parafrankia]MBE3206758.1 hypothetical protein [Parafrankia sp. CH37]CUU60832.1 hypothetical protein Ga0074812_14832 [Parafrankia irregularis]
MEGLIALYLLYVFWKTTVEAATNIVAAVKGRPIVVGSRAGAEAEEVARYATRGAGTTLGLLGWLLAQAFHAGREAADDRYGDRIHLARERRRYARAERRATRVRRHTERRGHNPQDAAGTAPDGAAPTCQICGQPGTDTDQLVTNGAVTVHQSHLADDELLPHCDVCGKRGQADDPLVTSEHGQTVHRSHLPPRCTVCGHRGFVDDPLVTTDSGARIHRSHLDTPPAEPVVEEPVVVIVIEDPAPTTTTPPAGKPIAADVTDSTGQRVDAVWEQPAAAAWASLRKPTP